MNTMKLVTWNKGNGKATNSIERIKSIILEDKPQLLFISELQLSKDEDSTLMKIEGYKLITDDLMKKFHMCRSGFYIQNDIMFT